MNNQNVRKYAPANQQSNFHHNANDSRQKLTVSVGLYGNDDMLDLFFFDRNVNGQSYFKLFLRERVLSLHNKTEWLPRSDLTPLIFFGGAYLKDKVFRTPPESLKVLWRCSQSTWVIALVVVYREVGLCWKEIVKIFWKTFVLFPLLKFHFFLCKWHSLVIPCLELVNLSCIRIFVF